MGFNLFKTSVGHIIDILNTGYPKTILDDKEVILLTQDENANAESWGLEIQKNPNGTESVIFVRGSSPSHVFKAEPHDVIHTLKVFDDTYNPYIIDCGQLNGTGDSKLGFSLKSATLTISGSETPKEIILSDPPISR
jgi:hypothetical protein